MTDKVGIEGVLCAFCGGVADGPMLALAGTKETLMAHFPCVLRKLNELLDPDYDGTREPAKIVGFSKGMIE